MEASQELRIQVREVMPAPRARVFAYLTEPWEVARWWGPHGFTIPSIDSDPSVGGHFRIALKPPGGELVHAQGEFLELDPPALISHTFHWGEPDGEADSVVRLRLTELDGSTEVSVEQGPFATEERRALHERAWSEGFQKLRRLLAA